ncbi:MAG: hypothetical protein AAB699_01290 [Patescibacteria group bacterium]
MFEIEIKSLLGSRERADELKRRLVQLFPALKTLPPHKQRNHYFVIPRQGGVAATTNAAHANETDSVTLRKAVFPLLSQAKQKELAAVLARIKGEVSIRTRDADGKVFIILKMSIGDDTSANGVSRIEFDCVIRQRRIAATTNAAYANEDKIRRPKTLEELDQILLDAGLSYQAKWSREREQYDLGHIHITIDKNAGYGYLAEFEKLIGDDREADAAKQELKALMVELGCKELPQERLERMFQYYNEHWQEYYGTDKVFVVE